MEKGTNEKTVLLNAVAMPSACLFIRCQSSDLQKTAGKCSSPQRLTALVTTEISEMHFH